VPCRPVPFTMRDNVLKATPARYANISNVAISCLPSRSIFTSDSCAHFSQEAPE
jgi:hypothetical protein